LLECREALSRWGFPLPPRQGVHVWVRLRFLYAPDKDLHAIGVALDRLCQRRNRADYNLATAVQFSTGGAAGRWVQAAADALALLDQIDGDPARRAAAVASIQP
jgi:hypothetical protein